MNPRFTVQHSILLAGTIAGVLLAAPAVAQQSAPAASPPAASPAAPLPPGSPLIGRPEGNEAASKLAPIAPPPIPAAADKLPTTQLKLPAGFNIEVYASGIPNARTLRMGDKGTIFVSNRVADKVYAITDKGGKREEERNDGSGQRAGESCKRGPVFEKARAHDEDREESGQKSESGHAPRPNGEPRGRLRWDVAARHRSTSAKRADSARWRRADGRIESGHAMASWRRPR